MNSNAKHTITFYQAEDGRIHRKRMTDLGNSVILPTSDVPVAPDIKSFRESHPNERVTLSAARNNNALQSAVVGATEGELAAMGLKRFGDVPEAPEPEAEEEEDPTDVLLARIEELEAKLADQEEEDDVPPVFVKKSRGWYEGPDGSNVREDGLPEDAVVVEQDES